MLFTKLRLKRRFAKAYPNEDLISIYLDSFSHEIVYQGKTNITRCILRYSDRKIKEAKDLGILPLAEGILYDLPNSKYYKSKYYIYNER